MRLLRRAEKKRNLNEFKRFCSEDIGLGRFQLLSLGLAALAALAVLAFASGI